VTEQTKELLSALMDGEASEIEVHRLLRQMAGDDSVDEVWVAYQETRRVLRRPSKNVSESGIQLSSRQHLELHRRISAAISDDGIHIKGSTLVSTSESNELLQPRSLFKPAFVPGSTEGDYSADGSLSADGSFPADGSLFAEGSLPAEGSKPSVTFKPVAALAIAASLVVAVFVGMQVSSRQGAELASAPSVSVSPVNAPSAELSNPNVQLASTEISAVGESARGNEANLENPALKELDAEAQLRLRTYLNQHDRMARMRSNAQLVSFPNQTKK
jgi:negative regulator of sigma E activity